MKQCMKILIGLVSIVFIYLIFTIVVRIRSRPKRNIKEIFHGHVYWDTDNATMNTSRNNLRTMNTSRNNLRSISEVKEDIKIPTIIPNPNPLPTLYVLTTGVRKFKNPSYFNVKMVYGETFVDSTATTFDEGFGPKSKWPIGAKLVADGHVTIWQKIMEECSGWCFVAEDDAQFPSTPPPKMPSDGYVSFYREGVCSKATEPYSKDFKRVIHRIVKGICMPYSTVAYALTKTHVSSLLSSLPMDKPVDHFLWEQGILNNRAFVSTAWGVKHVPGPSIKDMNKKPVLGPAKNIKKLPSIAVMLTSYNRKGYLETFSKWLASDPSYISGKFDLFVRDDQSSQYDKTQLKKWFPKAYVTIESVHHRSDRNIRLNFEKFVNMDYDLLLSIDSDSILDPSWHSFITENMPKEGFATLYHSSAKWHKTHHCRDGVWCHQSSTGSLGMVLSKELIRKMLLENHNSGFDWGIIDWLKKQKIPVRAPKKSLVLHYGYYGQNNGPRSMHELADNFDMTSIHKSVRPCIDWWLKANNPNEFCPIVSYSKKELVKTSISDYTKKKMPICTNNPSGKKWDTFKSIISVLNGLKAIYSISGGTVLFWYRDCSLGDVDIDINIDWKWFVSNAQKLGQTLKENNFVKIHSFGEIYRYGYEEAWKKNNIKVDLFTQANVNGKYISGTTINGVTYACYSFFDIYKTHTWNSLQFKVPEPIEPYLEKKYGQWKIPEKGYRWDISPFKRKHGRFFCDKKISMPPVPENIKCCLPTQKRCQWHTDSAKEIPNCEKENLLEMLKWIKKIFIEENVTWYLTAGTLLGATRSQSHIPYETDIDIMVSESTFEHALYLINENIKYTHYKLEPNSIPARLLFGNKNTVHVDLWKGKFDSETKTAIEYMKGNQGFGYYTFPGLYSVIFPLKKCEYESELYPCPNNNLKWVQMRFGNDWNIPKRKYGYGSTYIDGKDADIKFSKYKDI